MRLQVKSISFKIVLFYIIIAALWILLSDTVLKYLIPDIEKLTFWQTTKGIIFVLVTGIILYFHIKKVIANLSAEHSSRKKIEKELSHEKSLFKRITDTSPIAIMVSNNKGELKFANPAAEKLLGITRNKILERAYNTPDWEITDKDGNPFPENELPFAKVRDTLKPVYDIIHTVKLPDSRRIILSVNASPLLDENNNFDGSIAVIQNVTERINAEEQLRQSQITYTGILNSIGEGIYIQDKDSRFLYVNKAGEKLFGYSAEFLSGKTQDFFAAPGKNNLNEIRDTVERVYEGEQESIIFWGKTRDGRIFPSEVTLVNGSYFNKKVVIAVLRDITERLKSEKELRESEERYRLLFESNPQPMWAYELETLKFIDVNNAAVKKYGYTKEEFYSMTLNDIRPEEDRPELLKHVSSVTDHQKSGIWRHKHKNGNIIYVEIYSHSLVLGGRNTRLVLANDVSERVRTEKEKQELTNRLEHYLETSPTITYAIKLVNGNKMSTEWVSENVTNILGYTVDEVMEKDWWIKNIHPGDKEKALKSIESVFNRKMIIHEYRFVRKDGTIIWVHDELRILYNHDNTPVEIIGTWTDITELKLAEQELRRSESKYRQIFENIQDVYFETSLNGEILELSPSIEYLTVGQYSREHLIGKNMREFYIDNRHREQFVEILTREENVIDYEIIFVNRDGSVIPCSLSAKLFFQADGKDPNVVGTIRDISDRKTAESELIEAKENAEKANRLKTEFLAQMSHEIRTPINVILNSGSLIEDEINEQIPEDVKEFFPIMYSAGKRIIRTIDSILNMSELQTGTFEPNFEQLNIYDEILINLYNEFKHQSKIKDLGFDIVLKTENSNVIADSFSISQIFANLIDNAIKYTSTGKVEVVISRNEDNKLAVAVKDTGKGIREEFIPYLFDAFRQEEQGYSRKFEGNGLGLALVKKYCEINKAEIEVESKLKQGSIFRVVFNH